MLIFNTNLNGVEKFLHRIVEDAEISSSPDDIFVNNLNFLTKFNSAFMKIIEKMFIFVVFMVKFLTS